MSSDDRGERLSELAVTWTKIRGGVPSDRFLHLISGDWSLCFVPGDHLHHVSQGGRISHGHNATAVVHKERKYKQHSGGFLSERSRDEGSAHSLVCTTLAADTTAPSLAPTYSAITSLVDTAPARTLHVSHQVEQARKADILKQTVDMRDHWRSVEAHDEANPKAAASLEAVVEDYALQKITSLDRLYSSPATEHSTDFRCSDAVSTASSSSPSSPASSTAPSPLLGSALLATATISSAAASIDNPTFPFPPAAAPLPVATAHTPTSSDASIDRPIPSPAVSPPDAARAKATLSPHPTTDAYTASLRDVPVLRRSRVVPSSVSNLTNLSRQSELPPLPISMSHEGFVARSAFAPAASATGGERDDAGVTVWTPPLRGRLASKCKPDV